MVIRQNPKNIVQNGNFVNTDGWTPAGATLSVLNNKAIITASGTTRYPQLYQNLLGIIGDKIYIRAKVKVTNSVAQAITITCYGTNLVFQSTPAQDVVYTLLGIRTTVSASESLSIFATYPDTTTANGKIFEVQEAFAVNLSTFFGVGNEPTVAQCNQLYPFFFDGIKPSSLSKFLS